MEEKSLSLETGFEARRADPRDFVRPKANRGELLVLENPWGKSCFAQKVRYGRKELEFRNRI